MLPLPGPSGGLNAAPITPFVRPKGARKGADRSLGAHRTSAAMRAAESRWSRSTAVPDRHGGGQVIARTVAEVLAAVTGRSATRCSAADRVLEAGPGVDGLALLEVVETLQDRVIITVPDEVTARMRTVRDLQDAVGVLVVAAPVDTSTGKDSS